MKTIYLFLVLALICSLQSCKDRSDIPEIVNSPTLITAKGSEVSVKDIEINQATITYWTTKTINAQTNTIVKETFEQSNLKLDLSPLRTKIEEFLKMNPNQTMYFRVEVRQFENDIQVNNTKIMRAGIPYESISVNTKGIPYSGGAIIDKDNPYDWEKINQKLTASFGSTLLYSEEQRKPVKLVLSVYDLSRFTSDWTKPMDGTQLVSFDKGGAWIAYLGWNIEFK